MEISGGVPATADSGVLVTEDGGGRRCSGSCHISAEGLRSTTLIEIMGQYGPEYRSGSQEAKKIKFRGQWRKKPKTNSDYEENKKTPESGRSMRGGGGGGGRSSHGNYTNPCLTMHQPWASLLIFGIKRIEGRSWPSPIRGRLWIHAASKVPEEATIKAMEDFYREIYAVNGITDIKFPQHYPVSRLIGCVEVVGCVRGEELASWEAIPEGARLEGQTDFCWLCEQPQKLLIPFEMRGFQRVYNLEKKIYESAVRGLTPVKGPMPVRFPLPNPHDPFSLKPGSISVISPYKSCEVEKSSSLSAAIAGARAAATQFNKNDQNRLTKSLSEEHKMLDNSLDKVRIEECSVLNDGEQSNGSQDSGTSSHSRAYTEMKPATGASAKIFAAAVRGLKPPS